MMWGTKDLKSNVKKGLFFPLRFGDVVKLVKDFDLTQYDDSRLSISMENFDGESIFGYSLLDYVPTEEIAIFSLPELIDSELAKRATILALTKLSKLKVKPKNFIHNSYFCAYLSKKPSLVLTRRDITVKRKKYRGTDKLVNSGVIGRKSKEVKLEEIYI